MRFRKYIFIIKITKCFTLVAVLGLFIIGCLIDSASDKNDKSELNPTANYRIEDLNNYAVDAFWFPSSEWVVTEFLYKM